MKTKFIHYFLPSFLGVYFSYAQVQVETDSLPDLPPPTTSQPSTPSTNALDYVNIASTGNAQDFGDAQTKAGGRHGAASRTRGLFAGGGPPGRVNALVI